jgi:hypothetical protein
MVGAGHGRAIMHSKTDRWTRGGAAIIIASGLDIVFRERRLRALRW